MQLRLSRPVVPAARIIKHFQITFVCVASDVFLLYTELSHYLVIDMGLLLCAFETYFLYPLRN